MNEALEAAYFSELAATQDDFTPLKQAESFEPQ